MLRNERIKKCLKRRERSLWLLCLVLLVTFALLFAEGLGPPIVKAEPGPSVVGTSTENYATLKTFQRKTFYASNRFWAFYYNGSDLVYKTSVDAETWGNVVLCRESISCGTEFSVWFDGTNMHYATRSPSDGNVYYRMGTPQANGTISWSDTEQTAYDSPMDSNKHM